MPGDDNRLANHHTAVCKSPDGLIVFLLSVHVLPGASHPDRVRERFHAQERSRTLAVQFQRVQVTALHSPRLQLGWFSVPCFPASFSIDLISKRKLTL